jgi:hypothetical protein
MGERHTLGFMLAGGGGRGGDDRHGREVLGLVVLTVIVVVVVGGHARGGLRCSPLRHVDDKGFGDILAAGEVGIQRPAHLFLGS